MITIKEKIIVRQRIGTFTYGIYVFLEKPDGMYQNKQDKGMGYEEKLNNDGVFVDEPSIILSKDGLQELLAEITNLGVELPSVSKVHGLYEAQSEHLQDLRHLLKLDVVVNVERKI